MIYNVYDFPYDVAKNIKMQKKHKGNQGTRSKRRYKDIVSAFDIETSTIQTGTKKINKDTNEPILQGFMYVWQFQFGLQYTVIGRTWDEFILFLNTLSIGMKDDEYYCIHVHNLSYEFAYLSGIYPFKEEEVFCMESRRILKCDMFNHFEFRCSYLHSNSSLKMYLKNMMVEHQKLDGDEFNYSKIRYPWTQLTEKEMEYAINDVLGLVEALIIDMQIENDNFNSFPLTATGTVRRHAKRAMQKISHWYIHDQLNTYDVHLMLQEAFRGGNTHANRYYTGQIILNAKSEDESSAYPAQLMCEKFPTSQFFHLPEGASFEYVMDLINRREKAVLMRISISNVELINEFWGCPYLSKDKCRHILNGVYDNGRILSADYLETTITDVDLKILLNEYKWDDIVFFDVAYARYGKLPQQLRDLVHNYYELKTALKGKKTVEDIINYGRQKALLNSVYGMMVQNPIKLNTLYRDGEYVIEEADEKELLFKHDRNAFLNYAWGVWCTAWARYRLEEGLILAHKGNDSGNEEDGDFLYCDTDSIKYTGNIDWAELNEERKQRAIENEAFAVDSKGVTHYMGVFEDDGEYSQFSTLGAKKYVYTENGSDEIHCTIAGVVKAKGGKELMVNGGMKAFKEGFKFVDAGGTDIKYNVIREPFTVEVEGKQLTITSNAVIVNSTYTLSTTEEYSNIVHDAQRSRMILKQLRKKNIAK